MGLLINSDAEILRRFFSEAAKLKGIQVKYQYPIDMTFSKYAEEDPRGYSEFKEIDIIFEENPIYNDGRCSLSILNIEISLFFHPLTHLDYST